MRRGDEAALQRYVTIYLVTPTALFTHLICLCGGLAAMLCYDMLCYCSCSPSPSSPFGDVKRVFNYSKDSLTDVGRPELVCPILARHSRPESPLPSTTP